MSFPPLISGSSHAFLKNSSNQPLESISLSEKTYPRSYPLTIPNPWRGLSKVEYTTRCGCGQLRPTKSRPLEPAAVHFFQSDILRQLAKVNLARTISHSTKIVGKVGRMLDVY